MIGELAALITSLCFSATSVFFTLAGRRVGSLIVNRTRLVFAVLFLTITHWILLGQPFPADSSVDRWFWFGLSGIIGLVLGDAFLFQAFVWVGPRLSMLMMSLTPVISTILAWVFLSEKLTGGQLLGIAITIAGLLWVVLEGNGRNTGGVVPVKDQAPAANPRRIFLLGLLAGLGGATGQAVGLITARLGLEGDFSPLSGTLMRMLVGGLTLWIITILRGQSGETIRLVRENRRALFYLVGGSFAGPFMGVTFSLLAIQRAQIGIASTLMALPPVFLLPISYVVFKERFGWQAVIGTLLAMAGVSLLFLL